MQTRFLLGPAGSGKTYRCLAEIREALRRSSDGPPLLLLSPKQATFQLERQLMADPSLHGYTRLQILSFERLAEFALRQFRVPTPKCLSEEGRVMVLRALLNQKQKDLKIFRASARLTGFAQQLSLLLREMQRHQLSPTRLLELEAHDNLQKQLRDKLHDLALLLHAYRDWLTAHQLQDANHLLDVAAGALRSASSATAPRHLFANVWLDGFAEMTPQELELLAAVLPQCGDATLAFCLERETTTQPSWHSTWAVVAQTFRRCHARVAAIEGCVISIEQLANSPERGRFASNEALRQLEANWSQTTPLPLHKSKPEASNKIIRLVTCPDAEAEAVFAAREIIRHVRGGGRYRECAVIVRALEPHLNVLPRVFRRYELPFFMDRREAISHHPLAELTRFALRTVTFGWQHDDWFGALKSGLTPAPDDAIDELENEALARGWVGKVWREPLSLAAENAQVGQSERIRSHLLPPFEKLAAALSANSFTPDGRQVANALRELWRELKVEETLDRWNHAAAGSAPHPQQPALHATVLDQMQDWLDNLELAFINEQLPLRDWLPIIEAGLAGLTVGVVPPALDQVLIGAVDRSRNPDLKLALVLGLNEGTFPATPAPATLLTDADRDGLERQNVYLGPTKRQRLGHERYLGYIACTRCSERLALTRPGQGADGQPLNPSPFFDHVKRLSGVEEESFSTTGEWWQSTHCCELEATALRQTSVPELLELPALSPLIGKWRSAQQAARADALAPAVIQKLFGDELNSSVSALEDFAACPFKFFAARGLKLQERKEFQFDDRDKGSFHHDALEEFHRRVTASGRRWRDLTPVQAGQLAAEIGRELLSSFGNGKFLANDTARFTGELLIERLRRLVTVLVTWMPQYEFDPVASEIAFDDENGELPAWRLAFGNHALSLRGRIDRVDLLKTGGVSALAVVMDYKSRVRKLNATKLHHGLELQLLSYLGVLHHLIEPERVLGVKQLVPAGVFYIPLNGGAGRSDTSRESVLSTDGSKKRAAYQHSGRFLADELGHFDNRNQPRGDQFKYSQNADGSLSKRGNEALPAAEFTALREKVETHLRDYGRRIFAGEVSVSPFRLGTATACDYCDFRPMCRFDPWTQPFRQLRPPPKPVKQVPTRTKQVKPV
jgi:ATP-dependent helicase/nuclease subunit B